MVVEEYKGEKKDLFNINTILERLSDKAKEFSFSNSEKQIGKEETEQKKERTLEDIKQGLDTYNKPLNTLKELFQIATTILHIDGERLKKQNKQDILTIFNEHNQKIQDEDKKRQNRETQQKIIKEIKENGPDLIKAIEDGKVSIVVGNTRHTLSINNLKYIINHKQQIGSIDKTYYNIINLLTTYPHQLNTLIDKNIQAIDYRNELPENKKNWQTAIEGGAKELTTIFINNKKLIAKITGRKEEDITEKNMRDLRVFLLKNENILQTITQQFNYDDESKKITDNKDNKENNDTSNYTFRLIEQYNIPLDKNINDGGTGIGSIIKYYIENKNTTQTSAFCQEYEQKIRPGLNQKLQEIINQNTNQGKKTFKDNENNVQTIEDLIKDFRRNENQKQCTKILTELGNSLNENNKTEALTKQPMTLETIETGEKLFPIFETISDTSKTPEEKKTMERMLQGRYFQDNLQLKFNALKEDPRLQSFFQTNPDLKNRLNIDTLANLTTGNLNPQQTLLLKLVGKIFFSEKALTSYGAIDIDNEEAVRTTVNLVFNEALNDESLFKDFEKGAGFELDEKEKIQGEIVDLTNTDLPKFLETFDKKYRTLTAGVREYSEENIKKNQNLSNLFNLKVEKHLTKLCENLNNQLTDKILKKSNNISLPPDMFNNILKIHDVNRDKIQPNDLTFERDTFKGILDKSGISIANFEKFTQKIENQIKKQVEEEQKDKQQYKETVDVSFHKLMVSNRVDYTIKQLKDSPFTKGLMLDTNNPNNIRIGEDLTTTLTGTYEGQPCQVCIHPDGTVKITAYYDNSGGMLTFDNRPNFTLFQIPTVKDQEEIGYTTLKENGGRKDLYRNLDENNNLKDNHLAEFPCQKESGLCLLKIKELLGITEKDFNIENADVAKPYQFFKDLDAAIQTPEDAYNMRKFITGVEALGKQAQEGNPFIKENSEIFARLFTQENMAKEWSTKNFEENPYAMIMQHFVRKDGDEVGFKINDALNFIDSFWGGEVDCKERNQKILGQESRANDEQYRDYHNTPLTQYLKNLKTA